MKRSPEKAYRLRSPSLPSSSSMNQAPPPPPPPLDQDQRRQEKIGNWTGNIQGATNDSNDYKPSIRIIDGFPVEYSCQDNPREENTIDENDVQEMELEFDYDIVVNSQADVEGSIRSLEWSLLWNVARELGLHNCNFRKQDTFAATAGDNTNDRRSLFTPNVVVSLSSLDFDSIDSDAGMCGSSRRRVNDL